MERYAGREMAMPSPHSAVPWLQRQLLPAAFIEPSQAQPATRDRFIDGALVVVTAALGAAALASSWDARDAGSVWLDVGLGCVACFALAVRRRHPTAVAVVGLAATTVSVMAGFAALVALFNAAVRASPRALAWIFALSLVSNAVYPLFKADALGGYWGTVGLCVLVMSVAIGWGLFARTRRELVASLHERARRLESEQLLRVEQARRAERRRIAREMHDVLAHRLSLLSLHAGALEFRSDASPDEVAEAAGVIRASGQAALEELRAVIGLLREDDDGDGLEAPQPTLAEIPALLEESRAAGMDVSWEERGVATDAVPAVVGRAAFRVLQEALTNARKHAPGARVDVSLDQGPPLVLEVVSGRPSKLVDDERLPGAGLGLVGLAERVALLDGSLEHGEGAAGRFVIRATLPWEP
jgi:signal transduction histidine kinase